MTATYLLVSGFWGLLCYRHKEDILPMQVCCNNEYMPRPPIEVGFVDHSLGIHICADGTAGHRNACQLGYDFDMLSEVSPITDS